MRVISVSTLLKPQVIFIVFFFFAAILFAWASQVFCTTATTTAIAQPVVDRITKQKAIEKKTGKTA